MLTDFKLNAFDSAYIDAASGKWPSGSVSNPAHDNGFYWDVNGSVARGVAIGLTANGNKTGVYARDFDESFAIYDSEANDFDPARVNPDAKDYASGFKFDNIPLVYGAGLRSMGALRHRGDLNSEVWMNESMNDRSKPSTTHLKHCHFADGGETIVDDKSWYFYATGLLIEGAMESFKFWRLVKGALAHSTIILRPGEGSRFIRFPIAGSELLCHDSVRWVWDGGETMGAPPASLISGSSDSGVRQIGQLPPEFDHPFYLGTPQPVPPLGDDELAAAVQRNTAAIEELTAKMSAIANAAGG